MNKSCNLIFTLKETTRGSDKRTYGPYKYKYVKLDKPKTFKFKGMTKSHTQTHKIVGSLQKNSNTSKNSKKSNNSNKLNNSKKSNNSKKMNN